MPATFTKWIQYIVQGRNGPGPISVPGTSAGDIVGLVQYNDHGRVIESHGPFETMISVNDQVQQTSLVDLSTILPFFVYVLHP